MPHFRDIIDNTNDKLNPAIINLLIILHNPMYPFPKGWRIKIHSFDCKERKLSKKQLLCAASIPNASLPQR